MYVVYRKGLERDGSNPTLLYGYGGFNVSQLPRFSVSLLPWLERGGIYAVANLRGGSRTADPNAVLAKRLMGVNTYAISLAITTGVAPLLFVQVLYQQYFYSGTILLGWIWFNMLVLLMIGYYAAYLHKKFRGPWLGVSAVTPSGSS